MPPTFDDPAQLLRDRFQAAIRSAFPQIQGDVDPVISVSRQPQFGDFQCNAAMSLARTLGQKPRDVAKSETRGIANPYSRRQVLGLLSFLELESDFSPYPLFLFRLILPFEVLPFF